ncbi:PREDICTED: transducin-like enhancer protein 4, partial [Priapulus caudatus]|uniref:Transducin-like enhancer protein 4 n=1 Tax=Priapulus caudatus TaxID=37621 RepID=A0ABM1EY48_PRICU
MYPNRHPVSPAPHQPGQPFKFTVSESCDRIKEEFNFLQAQYHSLKMECEKLASEKTEMQRHYVMYYEMSYGLNVEMHKQTEIAKRLNAICAQIIPFLSQEHQQQVAAAVERAKQVTMSELNAIIGSDIRPGTYAYIPGSGAESQLKEEPAEVASLRRHYQRYMEQLQQMQAQHIAGGAPGHPGLHLPPGMGGMPPHPGGMPHPALPPT